MKIHLIAAARPNFMKIAPVYHALKAETWATPLIVHTGQHYDINMSDAFFQDLHIPDPDIHLGVGSGTHAEQTGRIMIAYEKILEETQPDLLIVVGDVNSTIACTLAAAKIVYPKPIQPNKLKQLNRPIIAHLESGLRSFDRTMPEEINRILTDALADILWTPSPDGDENLIKEGIASDKIERVGNIMIDSLEMLREKIEKERVYEGLSLSPQNYGLVTLHRPANVDNPEILGLLCRSIVKIAQKMPVVFPVHPRTLKNLEQNGLVDLLKQSGNIHILEPLRYIHFMNMVFNSRFVLTDSGGIQEETTYLGIPCLTMRPNTERPITVDQGTNILCSLDNMEDLLAHILSEKTVRKPVIDLWDGKTANRVVASIKKLLSIE